MVALKGLLARHIGYVDRKKELSNCKDDEQFCCTLPGCEAVQCQHVSSSNEVPQVLCKQYVIGRIVLRLATSNDSGMRSPKALWLSPNLAVASIRAPAGSPK